MSSRAQGDSPSRSVIRSTTIATACTTPSQNSQTLNSLNSVTRPQPHQWFHTHPRLTQPQRGTNQKETHSVNRSTLPKIHNPANWTSPENPPEDIYKKTAPCGIRDFPGHANGANNGPCLLLTSVRRKSVTRGPSRAHYTQRRKDSILASARTGI